MARLIVLVVMGPSSCEKIIEMLHMWIQASLHHQSLQSNRNLAARFWRLMLELGYDLRTLLHGAPTIFDDLRLC
jgi:hypothetical protein